MDSQSLPVAVGVRFSKVGKVYHFEASHIPDLQVGDSVVVETSRGWQIGSVVQLLPTPSAPGSLKEIDRRATPRDLLLHETWKAKQQEVWSAANQRARELNLAGVKVIAAEYTYDGTRLSIIYSSETDEKVDLKSLRQDMGRTFAPAQVEMRQIGPRDVAKLLGGMGACGLEQRCCSQFLCEFNSISIRMAKEQGISLTPTEITGMCGRLRCCLSYEFQQYQEMRAQLPRRNKHVMTTDGEARVLDQIPLREAVLVEYADGLRKEVPFAEVTLIEEGARPVPPPVPIATPAESAETPVKAEDIPAEPNQNHGSHRRDRRPRRTQPAQPVQLSQEQQPPANSDKPQAAPQGQGRRRSSRRRGGGGKKPDDSA
jgi:cell fate regulator YaaT (PSP1 superfamily)